jgi:hypothetical protein
MKQKIMQWVMNAKWWHFWNPGSRYGGGFITGLITGVIVMLILK